MPKNIKSITIIITFESIEKIKEKRKKKKSFQKLTIDKTV